MTDEQWEKWSKRVRDLGIWAFGVGAAWNELLLRSDARWPALAFIATMLGLPIAFRIDDSKKGKE